MCQGQKVVNVLSTCFKDWSFCSLDAEALLGALVIGWNDSFTLVSSSFLNSGILVELRAKDLQKDLKFLNIYEPYSDRRAYWDQLRDSGTLDGTNLILGETLS